ncbi:MAG: hypothetical protein M3011_07005 [Actinomycetota bacterium]|nr:hypothetical protein [Actinomycetota bacterium]
MTMTLATLVTGFMVSMAAAASAAGYPPGPQPPVVSQTLPPAPGPVMVASRAASSSSAVAFTGANILRWALIALVLVAVGALLVVVARRRAHAAA